MLQEFGLAERINDIELSVKLIVDKDCLLFWTCITGGDLDRRLKLYKGEFVVSVNIVQSATFSPIFFVVQSVRNALWFMDYRLRSTSFLDGQEQLRLKRNTG